MDHYGLVAGEKVYLHVPDGSGKRKFLSSYHRSAVKRYKRSILGQDAFGYGRCDICFAGCFDEMMQYYSEDNISYSDFLMLDYRQINTENASLYDGYMEQFKDADKLYNDNIRDTLERFLHSRRR